LSIFASCVSFLNHWFLSQGKLHISYRLIITACVCYAIIDTLLALRDPAQMGILVFNIGNIWAITMALRGLKRIKKRENNKPT